MTLILVFFDAALAAERVEALGAPPHVLCFLLFQTDIASDSAKIASLQEAQTTRTISLFPAFWTCDLGLGSSV